MNIDKSGWPRGEWDDEPNLLNFKTKEGFDAAIIRTSHSGVLCGYVGIPKYHPWYGLDYSAEIQATPEQMARPVDVNKVSILSLFCTDPDAASAGKFRIDCLVSVHGGLTYSKDGRADYGEDPALWYFGFDCAHSGDFCPAMDRSYSHGTYRDIEYVKNEIERLSEQLQSVLVPA